MFPETVCTRYPILQFTLKTTWRIAYLVVFPIWPQLPAMKLQVILGFLPLLVFSSVTTQNNYDDRCGGLDDKDGQTVRIGDENYIYRCGTRSSNYERSKLGTFDTPEECAQSAGSPDIGVLWSRMNGNCYIATVQTTVSAPGVLYLERVAATDTCTKDLEQYKREKETLVGKG